jgi:DNA polymerase III epsilon subunit-like protein
MSNVIELAPAAIKLPPVHIMVDTETLGMQESGIILSIGAVVFSVDGLGEEFYTDIDPSKYPGGVTISTVKFWMEQCKKGIYCPMYGENDIGQALNKFLAFLGDACGEDRTRLVIWANGTDFDIPKLGYAFNSCQSETPWGYSSVRDCRTIYKLFSTYGTKPEKVNHHNALADSKWQAEYLISIFKNLGEHVVLDF